MEPTPRQNLILEVITSNIDGSGECVVNIHTHLQYPLTPDSINPAIRDLDRLKELGLITNFQRMSSRVFKIIKQ